MIDKDQRRIVWLKENLATVLTWAGIDVPQPWSILICARGGRAVMNPELRDLCEPVIALLDLKYNTPDLGRGSLSEDVCTPLAVADEA